LSMLWCQTTEGFDSEFNASFNITKCNWDYVSSNTAGQVNALDLAFGGVNWHIPDNLGLLTALTCIYLQNNALTGTIPSSLDSLMALTDLTLYNNVLTGTVPFCSTNQSFAYLVADCGEVSCPCCTHCCLTGQGEMAVFDFC
jgi:hypothetical protein